MNLPEIPSEMKRGLVTYCPAQSATSFRAAREALQENGITLDLLHIEQRFLRYAYRAVLEDARLLLRALTGDYDFFILNSGALMLFRPSILAGLIAIASRRNIPLLCLWRNAPGKLAEVERTIGHARYSKAVALMNRTKIRHMAISQRTAEEVRELVRIQLPQVIFNCPRMPAEFRQPTEPGTPPVILNVASVIHRKGPDLFVDIARRVCERHPEVRFEWIGGGATPELAAQIEASGHADRIAFRSFTDKPLEAMQSATALFLSSREEAFGMVLAEAMACYRTVLCFSGTGAAEVGGDTGVALNIEDPEASADAIIDLLSKTPAESINYAARERYERVFSPQSYAQRLSHEIRECL